MTWKDQGWGGRKGRLRVNDALLLSPAFLAPSSEDNVSIVQRAAEIVNRDSRTRSRSTMPRRTLSASRKNERRRSLPTSSVSWRQRWPTWPRCSRRFSTCYSPPPSRRESHDRADYAHRPPSTHPLQHRGADDCLPPSKTKNKLRLRGSTRPLPLQQLSRPRKVRHARRAPLDGGLVARRRC